jgi:hypothetical protein
VTVAVSVTEPPTVIGLAENEVPTLGVDLPAGTVTPIMTECTARLQVETVQVPVTVTLYFPPGVNAVADTVRVEVPERILLVRTILAADRVVVGPFVMAGVTALVRSIPPVPLTPPRTLATVMMDVPDVVGVTVRVAMLAESAKEGRSIAIPVWAVSTLGAAPPLVMVTQTPGTLEPEVQVPLVVAEVRKLTGAVVVAATT